jgi:RES domain
VPLCEPPLHYSGEPTRYPLRRGTVIWRVHQRPYAARAFNSRLAKSLYGGARFDATSSDAYPYYYAALDEETALAETLLRGLPSDQTGHRAVPRSAVECRQISALVVTRDLELVSLITGKDLAAIGQDAWLVTSDPHDYPQTRDWGHWLRAQAKWAHGFVWNSLRDTGRQAIVLFGDRCAADFGTGYERLLLHEVTELGVDLDDAVGATWLNDRFGPYRAGIAPP